MRCYIYMILQQLLEVMGRNDTYLALHYVLFNLAYLLIEPS